MSVPDIISIVKEKKDNYTKIYGCKPKYLILSDNHYNEFSFDHTYIKTLLGLEVFETKEENTIEVY